jgi:polyisoprenoid-binding protein YceI
MWCDPQRSWTGIALTLAVAGWGPAARHDPPDQPAAVPAATLGEGTLSFDGHATTGDFVGTTSGVTGAVLASPDYASVHGWVEARVATLRTGNGLRDRDLRKVMEVDTYPTMRYDVSGATVRSATRPDSVSLVLHGTLRLHGVARTVDVPVTVARGDGAARVFGTFPLNVTDYGVRGLSKMMGMLKMHEGIEVHLALRFVIAG